MAIIKIKRGPSSNITSLNLEAGEPAFTTDNGKLYIGTEDGKALINPNVTNVETADKLTNARTLALSGDATASGTFNGSENLTLETTLANSGVTAGTHTKLTVDAKGRVTYGTTLSASDIPTLTVSKLSDAGTAAKANTGTASGNVPVLNTSGKLDSAVLPAIAITDTFVVASQTAMLALSSAEVGDIAVRTDVNKSYVLKTAGYSTLANWQELLTPTDTVLSVNGKNGAVTLAASDLGLGNVDNTADSAKNVASAATLTTPRTVNGVDFDGSAAITNYGTCATAAATAAKTVALTGFKLVTGAVVTVKFTYTNTAASPTLNVNSTGAKSMYYKGAAITSSNAYLLANGVSTFVYDGTYYQLVSDESKAPIASPTFTGTPTAPTQATDNNSTRIATTAFVKAQGYLTNESILDGGTF